jgi:hypothetical protein
MNDRTMKTLLALIAVALWGILLRPDFLPARAQAQAQIKQVEYGYITRDSFNGDHDSLLQKLNDSAKRGWRAKNVALGGNGYWAFVLLERELS